jgi:protocatechuate 3,4-dioxygenase beta subunit
MRWPITLGGGGVLCLLLVAPMARAQGTSAASVAGTVKDTSGAVLPGVTVEAASPALIEKVRTTVSGEQGEYRINELRPGTYTVTFTLRATQLRTGSCSRLA